MDTPLEAARAAPGTGTARHDQHPAKDTELRSASKVAPGPGRRRRRAASDQMEPLVTGVRDPIDELPAPPVRQVEYGMYDVITLGLTCRHDDETCPARSSVVAPVLASRPDHAEGAA